MSLYLEASQILQLKSGSLKSRIYNAKHGAYKSPPARLYALIVETLKHQEILNEVIANSGLLQAERKLTHPLALLLLHDHLLTKSGIAASTGPLKTSILNHKARLSAEFTKARIRRGHGTLQSLLAATAAAAEEAAERIPRWARVNTLKTSLASVLSAFQDYAPIASIPALLSAPPKSKLYYVDPFIPSLLAFPPSAPLTKHPLYTSGALILQDRSSCIPAVLLNAPVDAVIVDATAAPGNKTTHLAALSPRASITAFEKDPRRAETLERMVKKAGGHDVIGVRAGADFLVCDPRKDEALREATHLMLDPSCSGSGIVGRKEYVLIPPPGPRPQAHKRKGKKRDPVIVPGNTIRVVMDDASDEEENDGGVDKPRLLALAEFQKRMVLHAMTFPKARRISYSTCSVHREENEDVVLAVLGQSKEWRVEKRGESGLKKWPRRGLAECGDPEVAEACVRCLPVEDGGIGFFAVVFVRNEGAEEEEEWKGCSDGE